MKNLSSPAEAISNAQQVFLPNRYQEPFIEAYQSLTGEEVPQIPGRKLSARSRGKLFRLFRGRDIPQVVELASKADPGANIVGFTGSEWYEEFSLAQPNTLVRSQLLGNKTLGIISVIAAADSNVDAIRARLNQNKAMSGAVTVYPNLVRAYAANLSGVIPVNGAVESVAAQLGILGVDLVAEGKTIAANNFEVVQELLPSYPALVQVPNGEGT